MNPLMKDVPALVVAMVLLWPIAHFLSKKNKRRLRQRIIAVLQKCRLISIGKLTYGQLEWFGIADVDGNNRRIIWSKSRA